MPSKPEKETFKKKYPKILSLYLTVDSHSKFTKLFLKKRTTKASFNGIFLLSHIFCIIELVMDTILFIIIFFGFIYFLIELFFLVSSLMVWF